MSQKSLALSGVRIEPETYARPSRPLGDPHAGAGVPSVAISFQHRPNGPGYRVVPARH